MSRLARITGRTGRRRGGRSLRGLLSLAASITLVGANLPLVAVPVALAAPATCGSGDPGVVAGTCTVTIDARDFSTGAPLATFNYIVSVDNTKLPGDPLSLSTESNSPTVRTGGQDRTSFTLPDGRYLVSVRSSDHKMWGAYFTLPNAANNAGNLTERIELTEQSADHPLPLGRINVFVFNDNTWTNGAPDTEEAGLGGFQVGLDEQTGSSVTVDYNNVPLCGGTCVTSSSPATLGFVSIPDMGPATYFIDVQPPEGPCNSDPNSRWYQTTTIDGGLQLIAPTEEGADGTGAPGEQLWEPPNIRTAYWFGFVCAPQPFRTAGTGEITGTARNWVEWAPYTTGTWTDPVADPLVALSDATTDSTVWVGRGDGAGNIDIQNVPAGDYNIAVWDEQLSYIMRFKPVHVNAGATVDLNDIDDAGNSGLGVSRWFGWLDGYVYKDTNNNGMYDPGVDTTIANTDMDQRWRDGSIKESTITGPDGYYEYPTAEGGALGRWIINEQGFARFSAYPGPSMHDEHTDAVTPSCDATPVANPCIPTDQGGGLLTNQLLLEGHRATVDWGKRDYPAGTPGQIVGITYFATTRNEFDASKAAHEDYEPAIPNVTVLLEGLGPDGQPNTADDTILNKYVTDKWQHPTASQDPQAGGNSFTQSCNPITDMNGGDVTSQFNPDLGPNCLEVPLTGQHTKDGAFDGGYAFADYCPNGYDMSADDGTCNGGSDPVALVAGTYITHVIMPKDPTDTRDCNANVASVPGDANITSAKGSVPGGGQGCIYRLEKEDDVNVDLGNNFAPAIPDPPCTGDDHVIDQSTVVMRSNYFGVAGAHAPLCDKKLIVLNNGQNANADFHMMTNFLTDPNGSNASDTRTGDVAEPGRIEGQVFNDIYFERNQLSNWYGEPRPIAGIPIGIYARVDTARSGCPGGQTTCVTGKEIGRDGPAAPTVTYDGNTWRLLTTLTTSTDGAYEALLPSTETLNCPIPQGPCPGMYLVTVDDPGTKAHPNANYNPNVLTATTPAEVWPGLTDQLDTPVDPISGTACEDPAGGTAPDPSDPARPDLLQVDVSGATDAPSSSPVVAAAATGVGRRVAILSDFIGTTGPALGAGGVRVTLTDDRTGDVTTLTRANGGIVSWTPGSGSTADRIVIAVPAINTNNFRPGPKQLNIVTANVNGGVSSVEGITLHVLGSNGTGASLVTYNPTVVHVAAPPPLGSGSLQAAIDAAAPGSLLVLSPGTYNENVLVWKPLKIQGLGPGGIIGAHELQGRDPEDPRFNIVGSIVDGRFFQQNFTAFDAEVAAHAPFVLPNFTSGSPSVVLRGADLTVAAQSTTAFNVAALPVGQDSAGFAGARIDGLGLMTGHGDGAGGVQLQASINNLQITNNILENNGGIFAGGIGLGQPYVHGSHNFNVRIANDRIIGNGGLTTSGGIGIFYGSNNYDVARSVICSNFSVEYGAGISHIGLSPNGNIHDNRIYYNEAVDSGGGIAIESELPQPVPPGGSIGDGSGAVNIDRNLIQSNTSTLDDGGGIFVLDALTAEINIRNNMVVDNVAADLGAGIMLDDASNVRIVNNTVANNTTTASSENSAIGVPHGAGLTSEANDPVFMAMLPAARTDSTGTTTTSNSATVLDTHAVLADLGKGVSGPRIRAGSTIISVTAGASFVMSLPTTVGGGTQHPALVIAPTDFSNPTALFNNIFWNNDAMTLTQFGPGATLTDNGFIDFEVAGTTNAADSFAPRFSDLTNGNILGPNGVLHALPAGQGNTVGADPGFVAPFVNELAVAGSRLDPQQAAVSITGQDPPVGLTGDYHILLPAGLAARLIAANASAVIDRGVRCSNTAVPAPANAATTACAGSGIQAPLATTGADYDSGARPINITVRTRTPWDMGADESTVAP